MSVIPIDLATVVAFVRDVNHTITTGQWDQLNNGSNTAYEFVMDHDTFSYKTFVGSVPLLLLYLHIFEEEDLDIRPVLSHWENICDRHCQIRQSRKSGCVVM